MPYAIRRLRYATIFSPPSFPPHVITPLRRIFTPTCRYITPFRQVSPRYLRQAPPQGQPRFIFIAADDSHWPPRHVMPPGHAAADTPRHCRQSALLSPPACQPLHTLFSPRRLLRLLVYADMIEGVYIMPPLRYCRAIIHAHYAYEL